MGMHQEAVASVFVALPSVQRFEVNPTGAPCELSNVVSASSVSVTTKDTNDTKEDGTWDFVCFLVDLNGYEKARRMALVIAGD